MCYLIMGNVKELSCLRVDCEEVDICADRTTNASNMTFELSEIQVREYKLGHFLSALQLFSSAADLYLYFLHPPYDSFHLNSKPTSRVTTGSDTSLSARSQFTITSWSFKMTLRPQPMLPHEYSWDETEKITRAILTVIYTDWNIPFDDVKKMITFTSTFIALDDA